MRVFVVLVNPPTILAVREQNIVTHAAEAIEVSSAFPFSSRRRRSRRSPRRSGRRCQQAWGRRVGGQATGHEVLQAQALHVPVARKLPQATSIVRNAQAKEHRRRRAWTLLGYTTHYYSMSSAPTKAGLKHTKDLGLGTGEARFSFPPTLRKCRGAGTFNNSRIFTSCL